MSFDHSKFNALLSSMGVSIALRASVIHAARVASGEVREIKVGDLFRSPRGVRMVVRLSNTTYGLVSVKSFSPHEEAGKMLYPSERAMTMLELEQYISKKYYDRVGHISETNPASILPREKDDDGEDRKE